MPMKTNESAENYLETILILSKAQPAVRSIDIAEKLGFKKSSVSVELDVSTSEASVDMEADNTNTTTIPIRISGSVDNICGMIPSKIILPASSCSSGASNSLPNPPRK